MPRTYPKSDVPSPPLPKDAADFLREGDVVTFTSAQRDPEKSSRGAEIRSGVVVLRHAWKEVHILENTLPKKRRRDAKAPRVPKEWNVLYVRLRTVRRGGEVIAKLPHILGDR